MRILPRLAFALSAAALLATAQAQVFQTLHQFEGPDGREPNTAMTVGPDGNLYGTTPEGGANGVGVIFRYTREGEFEVLADLNPATHGSEPKARLLNIGDGFLYGATFRGTGATNKGGAVFRLDPATGNVTVIHDVPDTVGTPYRATYLASGEPNVLHVLCQDNSGIRRVPLDGSQATFPTITVGTPVPQSFIRASNGFLYGGTYTGGTNQTGTLFRANPDGSGYTVILNCTDETGIRPIGAMVEAPDGNLYGLMSERGGPNSNGVLYRLTLDGQFSVVRRFNDFRYLQGDLLVASDGMLYGTGWDLGPGGNGNGGIWRIKTNGTGYKVLHVFKTGVGNPIYPTGRKPVGGLVQAPDGDIYGTTEGGVGSGAAGTIFRLRLKLPAPPQNRAPIALDDTAASFGSQVAVNVLANDFDPDNDGLIVSVKESPDFGTATVQPDGTILYVPDGSYQGQDQFTYEVNDFRGGKSEAVVRIVAAELPPLVQPGLYNGLVVLDPALQGDPGTPRGQFQIVMTNNRKFTGTMTVGKKRVPLKGQFTEEGASSISVTLPDRSKAVVYLAFQSGQPSTLRLVVFGQELWNGIGGQGRGSGSEANELYTVVLPASDSNAFMPEGHGYATMTIKPTGVVSVIGKLGDGSVLNWTTQLVRSPGEDKGFVFYSEPVKGGYIAGGVVPGQDDGEEFVGMGRWHRPQGKKDTQPYFQGFTGDVELVIGRFTPPTGTNPVLNIPLGVVVVSGPGISGQLSGEFTLEGRTITRKLPLKSLTINRANGSFSGVIMDGKKAVNIKGVVNQGFRGGLGHYIKNGVTGAVELGSNAAD